MAQSSDTMVVAGPAPGALASSNLAYHLLPAMLGFVAPPIALIALNPALLEPSRGALAILLVPAMVIAGAAALAAALWPRTPAGLLIDRRSRTIEIVWQNWASQTRERFGAMDVVKLENRITYDQDGYRETRLVLALRNGRTAVFRQRADAEHLAAARLALGLARS